MKMLLEDNHPKSLATYHNAIRKLDKFADIFRAHSSSRRKMVASFPPCDLRKTTCRALTVSQATASMSLTEKRVMTYAEQMLRMLNTETLRSMIAAERKRIEPDWRMIDDFEAEIERREKHG